MEKGFPIGPQADLAGPVAEKFARWVGHERVTFCNTGSEAVMAAMRVARTVTGRDLVVVFDIEADASAVAERLSRAGVDLTRDGRSLVVRGDDASQDAVRDACADTGAAISRLDVRRLSLEDVYLAGAAGQGHRT